MVAIAHYDNDLIVWSEISLQMFELEFFTSPIG